MKPCNQAVSAILLALPVILLGAPGGAHAQEVIRPDLAGIATGEGWTLANRGATTERDGGQTIVNFDGRPGSGAAWLDGVEFENGTIEVNIKGKNNPGGSFVGVAFRGVDDDTYDAVYFRPFNFVADNDLSRSHMVQYVSHPEHTWFRLREAHTDVYENALVDPPNPDEFFRARIVISKPDGPDRRPDRPVDGKHIRRELRRAGDSASGDSLGACPRIGGSRSLSEDWGEPPILGDIEASQSSRSGNYRGTTWLTWKE